MLVEWGQYLRPSLFMSFDLSLSLASRVLAFLVFLNASILRVKLHLHATHTLSLSLTGSLKVTRLDVASDSASTTCHQKYFWTHHRTSSKARMRRWLYIPELS